jgi:hypothetical protein
VRCGVCDVQSWGDFGVLRCAWRGEPPAIPTALFTSGWYLSASLRYAVLSVLPAIAPCPTTPSGVRAFTAAVRNHHQQPNLRAQAHTHIHTHMYTREYCSSSQGSVEANIARQGVDKPRCVRGSRGWRTGGWGCDGSYSACVPSAVGSTPSTAYKSSALPPFAPLVAAMVGDRRPRPCPRR